MRDNCIFAGGVVTASINDRPIVASRRNIDLDGGAIQRRSAAGVGTGINDVPSLPRPNTASDGICLDASVLMMTLSSPDATGRLSPVHRTSRR
jgi:hypothetical protein